MRVFDSPLRAIHDRAQSERLPSDADCNASPLLTAVPHKIFYIDITGEFENALDGVLSAGGSHAVPVQGYDLWP